MCRSMSSRGTNLCSKGNLKDILVKNSYIIVRCVFVIIDVVSYHAGERDVLFLQYVLICFLPIFCSIVNTFVACMF